MYARKSIAGRSVVYGSALGCLIAGGASGQSAPAAGSVIDSGDTAWVMISTALVMLMSVPGLAFFYSGLVRRKNVLSVLMQCLAIVCLVSIQWVLVGYSLSFGPDKAGLIGDLSWTGLNGVGLSPAPEYASTIPHQLFMAFQMMFAVITPALIIGAFAERMRFLPFCVFTLLWATLVYDPVAHWMWGVGGFLRAGGALDFAGGTVVHIVAGAAALAATLVLGKRQGYPERIGPPHNLPFAVLGAGLLWFGWFGFNAGSALAANGLAVSALVTTHISAAAAGLTWATMDMIFSRRPTILGIISGAVAGLVSITPGAGYVSVLAAMAIGGGAGIFCYLSVVWLKVKLGYDDALDAFGIHGIGGIWGALATGLWASKASNPAGADGLFYGNPGQCIIQMKAALVTLVFAFAASYILLKLVDFLLGLRVDEHAERIGLDLAEHREAGYTMLE